MPLHHLPPGSFSWAPNALIRNTANTDAIVLTLNPDRAVGLIGYLQMQFRQMAEIKLYVFPIIGLTYA